MYHFPFFANGVVMITLEEIVEKMYAATTDKLKEQAKDAAMPPLALIFKGDNLGVIPCQQLAFAGPAWTAVLSEIIKSVHEQNNIDAYGVAQESFALIEPTIDDMKEIMAGKPVSQMSNREEVLVIQAGNTFQTIERLWNIIRDSDTGMIVDFNLKELPPGMPIFGGFNDLLLVERPERLN
jgi:hypothetical protein